MDLLVELGYQVETASCGREAVEKVRSAGEPFDLVLGSPPYWPLGTRVEAAHPQAIPARLTRLTLYPATWLFHQIKTAPETEMLERCRPEAIPVPPPPAKRRRTRRRRWCRCSWSGFTGRASPKPSP